MGSFEDSIKESFENNSVKTPPEVWDKVESELNADLVHSYESSQAFQRWVTAAAILIAFISLAFQFRPKYKHTSSSKKTHIDETFNALLSKPQDYFSFLRSSYLKPMLGGVLLHPIFVEGKIENHDPFQEPLVVIEDSSGLFYQTHNVSATGVKVLQAQVNNEIYPYHQGATFVKSKQKIKGQDTRLWASIEAGAGNFNTSLTGSNAFSGSINQSNLASVLGSEGFINPTANVNAEMNAGLATSIGLDFGLRLSDKWTLETGLAYTNVDSQGDASINVLDIYTINYRGFSESLDGITELAIHSPVSRETTLEVQDSYDYNLDVNSSFQFTSIPMKAGYFVMDRKVSVRLNVGLAANYFVGSRVNGSGDVINGSVDDSFNTWSFDGLSGIEFGYSILNRFDVTLEPNYRQSITPLNGSTNTSSRFIFQTGLRYKIQ
ncbi:MAG: hypothetical protein AAGC64_05945 [Bacteroidota bacterium]